MQRNLLSVLVSVQQLLVIGGSGQSRMLLQLLQPFALSHPYRPIPSRLSFARVLSLFHYG